MFVEFKTLKAVFVIIYYVTILRFFTLLLLHAVENHFYGLIIIK